MEKESLEKCNKFLFNLGFIWGAIDDPFIRAVLKERNISEDQIVDLSKILRDISKSLYSKKVSIERR